METGSESATVGTQKGFNFKYLISLHGIFRIVQFVSFSMDLYIKMSLLFLMNLFQILGIIVCSCVGGAVCNSIGCFSPSFAPGSGYEGQGYVIFVGVICILGNALFVVLNVLNLVDQPHSVFRFAVRKMANRK